MCNLSQGIKEAGLAEGLEKSQRRINSMVKKMYENLFEWIEVTNDSGIIIAEQLKFKL